MQKEEHGVGSLVSSCDLCGHYAFTCGEHTIVSYLEAHGAISPGSVCQYLLYGYVGYCSATY